MIATDLQGAPPVIRHACYRALDDFREKLEKIGISQATVTSGRKQLCQDVKMAASRFTEFHKSIQTVKSRIRGIVDGMKQQRKAHHVR